MIFSILVSAPLSPPGNFTGRHTSAWCLQYSWSHIPVKQAQGIITGYNIYIKELPAGATVKHTTGNVTVKEICGLKPYTRYQASIKGFTKVGEGGSGSQSGWKTVRTDEDGVYKIF